jgi:molybdopterin/thiamine biosynthesis adenylyltransferase
LGDPLWVIDATLKARGFYLSQPPSTYRGSIFVHGNEAKVEITIPDPTFVKMPTIRLIDDNNLPANLAHLNSDDTICYIGEGGLPLDLYNPGGSILRVLRESEVALERSFGGRAIAEYEAELASYWKGNTIHVALSSDKANGIFRGEIVDIGESGSPQYVVVPTDHWKHLKTQSRQPTTILSFTSNLRYSETFKSDSLAGIVKWLEAQAADQKSIREAVLASATNSEPIFVISPNALIGWRPILPTSLSALLRKSGVRKSFSEAQVSKSLDNISLERMTGIRFDLRHVVQRNLLNRSSLMRKRISLVGAGTIGGSLATLLVKCGAGCDEELVIYDTDKLRPGNLGRHVLGFAELGQPKAPAMADLLRKFHPDVRVRPLQRDALQEWDALERSDLIIDATGDYNVATALTQRRMMCKKDGSELAMLHAWVFGNGIAAQTLLNLNDGLACYRCLCPTFGEPWRYTPAKDVKKVLDLASAACGEAGYVPFAADAPVAATSLALRSALDWAAGKPGPRLRTITLDHDQGKYVKWVSPSRSTNCPACG